MIINYHNKIPQIHPDAFIAPTAVVIGDVRIGKNSSIWFGTVLRADINYIQIGERTSVQDNTVVHLDRTLPTIIGDDVTVGHGAILHGCTIGNCCLVGMGAIVLDGAEIGEGCIVAAGSVVKEGEKVPPFTLVAGIPAVVKKQLDVKVKEKLLEHAQRYSDYADTYK
jgi:carbonic anhydrase/acetyltransferase-like protein (isoleucine patch superfamily)